MENTLEHSQHTMCRQRVGSKAQAARHSSWMHHVHFVQVIRGLHRQYSAPANQEAIETQAGIPYSTSSSLGTFTV